MEPLERETTSNKSKMINRLKHMISPTSPPWKTETTGDIRNIMLVGAALIATVTFQAGITPPGGVWQESKDGHQAGHAVYSDQRDPFKIFLICNTIALTSSTFLLLCLTYGYPYFLEVLIATISMLGTYSSGIYCIVPHESQSFYLIFVAAPAPIVTRFVIWVVAFAARCLGFLTPNADRIHARTKLPESWYLPHIFALAEMFCPSKPATKRSASWFKRFQYNESRDSPSDARNVLLVVVALIAAVTFQAGVNPPGGVWQEGEHAGRAIYASQKFAFYIFLVSNTLALSSCILLR
ncbi:hypothetical protein SADUNF_Sadunf14G0032400 [Salix dunnii]|uniref:PGG domain-containing protein n=1 Tax=Salix dunnii TaxID=1413687 RepID=A0A835JG36_9ROSI|nr:hypothetical protein SADUNF_Sadunf14G0032400 [Salix dunnii]